MAGYKGYSMSNNAVSAYENGEKPLSKWTKTAIMDELDAAYLAGELPLSALETADGMKADELKAAVLRRSSWHHTSKFYNRTVFYSVDIESARASFCPDFKPEEKEDTLSGHVVLKFKHSKPASTREWWNRTQETVIASGTITSFCGEHAFTSDERNADGSPKYWLIIGRKNKDDYEIVSRD